MVPNLEESVNVKWPNSI